jgi:hypothetical protein
MLAEDVKVTKTVEDSKYERDGSRTSIIRIEFFVGKHGPFVERFVKDDYTSQLRDDKLNAWAEQVRTA